MVRILIADGLPGLNKGEIAMLEGILESLDSLGVQVMMPSVCWEINVCDFGDGEPLWGVSRKASFIPAFQQVYVRDDI